MFSRLSLNQRLSFGGIVVLVLSAAISLALIGMLAANYWHARENLRFLTIYGQLLTAENLISAERGPTNAVLDQEALADGSTLARRERARLQSDQMLNGLTLNASDLGVDPDLVAEVGERLQAARAEVDRLSALPRSQRRATDLQHAIDDMFSVFDALKMVTSTSIGHLVKQDPTLASVAMTGQILSDLREYAGRYGSCLVPSIIAGEALPPRAIDRMAATRERILILWQLAESQIGLNPDASRLVGILRHASALYLGAGMPFVDTIAEEGRNGANYSVSAADMTSRYVMSLTAIETLRTAFVDSSMAHSKAARDNALFWLLVVASIAGLIVAEQIAILWMARKWVFRPLQQALDQIDALADDRQIGDVDVPDGAHEMRRLFESLQMLRRQWGERSQRAAHLQVEAETDGLTGLMNRRALERFGQAVVGAEERQIGFILLDVDRFKTINDTYGHLAGDAVLKGIADRIRESLPDASFAARYGGEEIAIVLRRGSAGEASALAEHLRHVLERAPVCVEDLAISVTASFGVAAGSRGVTDWLRVVHEADRALYRAKAQGRNAVVCDGDSATRDPRSRIAS